MNDGGLFSFWDEDIFIYFDNRNIVKNFFNAIYFSDKVHKTIHYSCNYQTMQIEYTVGKLEQILHVYSYSYSYSYVQPNE